MLVSSRSRWIEAILGCAHSIDFDLFKDFGCVQSHGRRVHRRVHRRAGWQRWRPHGPLVAMLSRVWPSLRALGRRAEPLLVHRMLTCRCELSFGTASTREATGARTVTSTCRAGERMICHGTGECRTAIAPQVAQPRDVDSPASPRSRAQLHGEVKRLEVDGRVQQHDG